ncbi:MAG: ABC-2 family transporter protein [Patescibacteria group bacterium]
MKYLRTFILSFQTMMQYRADLFLWFFVGVIPAFSLILVWLAILGDKQSINGFTKGDFIVYYFFQTVSWYIVGGTFSRVLGTRIKNGQITMTLLKPYNLVLSRVIMEQAWKMASLILTFPVIIFMFYVFRGSIHLHFTVIQVLALVISLILGGVIFALIESMIGLSAFWIAQVWPLADFFWILLGLFGGRLVPISLMPHQLQVLSQILPFKYIFYTPLTILLNKSTDPVRDILIQFLFMTVAFICYMLVWKNGVKKYEAVGG